MIKKLSISIILVIAFIFSFTVFAHADVVGGAGLLSGALSSIGIDLLTGGSATVATLAPWLNNNYSLIGDLTGIADGYIKIGDSSVFIDGKEFESVFLDPNMAQSLHTQILDFKSQFGIVSNSSAIIATGLGYIDGVDVYNTGNNNIKSSRYYLNSYGQYSFGNIAVQLQDFTTATDKATITLSNGTTNNNAVNKRYQQDYGLYFSIEGLYSPSNPSITAGVRYYTTRINNVVTITIPVSLIDYDPFDYSYVSGEINTDPLPTDYGFQVFVPVDDLEDAGFYPGTIILDGSTGTDEIIQLIQLLDEIFENEEILNPEFTDVINPPPCN